jgi:hypothetical protein
MSTSIELRDPVTDRVIGLYDNGRQDESMKDS